MKRFRELALPAMLAAPLLAGLAVVALLLASGATGDGPVDTASTPPSAAGAEGQPTQSAGNGNPRDTRAPAVADPSDGDPLSQVGKLAEKTKVPPPLALPEDDQTSDQSADEGESEEPDDNGAYQSYAQKLPVADEGESEEPDDNGFFHITPEDRKRLEEERRKELERLAREEAEAIKRLGDPLVEKTHLRKLHKKYPIWVDPVNKHVVMIGEVCRREAPLEMFACPYNTKEHESVLSIRTEAYLAHAALLAVGAKPGHPARFDPKYQPATGTEIEIKLYWKDDKGVRRSGRAQDWVRNADTGKAMEHPWVFAGSGFWKDTVTGQQRYMAEDGDFICVSNFSTAMLDLPVESPQSNPSLLFECFTERIPPRGTAVTVVLEPKLPKKPAAKSGPEKPQEAKPAQAPPAE